MPSGTAGADRCRLSPAAGPPLCRGAGPRTGAGNFPRLPVRAGAFYPSPRIGFPFPLLGGRLRLEMLTGDAATVRRALHKFGLDTDPKDPGDHLNVLYMANLRTGLWEKVFSLAPLDDLEQLVHQVESDRGP